MTDPGNLRQAEHAAHSAAEQRWLLTPHRSLGRPGFIVLMGAVSVVSFAAGLAFALMGAWPVAGFFGLDVLLIWGAFRLNYRAARRHEIVELYRDALVVTHVSPAGRRRAVRFNPYWVRLVLDEHPSGSTRLALSLHGRETTFASVLNDDDRRSFAADLERALAEARTRTG